MSSDQRFDDCAKTYDATVQRAIGASGENVGFFADLKARLMSETIGHRRPGTILDFGCGIGNTTRAIAARFPNSRVFGFDVSAESIEVARGAASNSTQIEYETSSDDALPFRDASLDAAFTSCVFHHIEPSSREHWARELRRVLRPGAPLIVFEHNPYNPLTVRVVRHVPFDDGVVLLTARDTMRLLRQAGFRLSRPWFYFFFPAFLRILRPLEPALKRIPIGAQYFVVGWR